MVSPRDDERLDGERLAALIEDWRAKNAPLWDRVRHELDEEARAQTEAEVREAFAA